MELARGGVVMAEDRVPWGSPMDPISLYCVNRPPSEVFGCGYRVLFPATNPDGTAKPISLSLLFA